MKFEPCPLGNGAGYNLGTVLGLRGFHLDLVTAHVTFTQTSVSVSLRELLTERKMFSIPGARFSKVPVTYRALKLHFKMFFADYTVITDMLHGQCFHRIIRF